MHEGATDRDGPHAGAPRELLLPVAWRAIAGRLEELS